MFEFQQRVLPESMYNRLPRHSATAYICGATTTIQYVNNLPKDPLLRRSLTIDESIHWADPLNAGHVFNFYTGPIPTVVHLHGAEVQSTSDGTPVSWFTNDGRHGPGYFTASQTSANAAIYEYPNQQQSTTLWFPCACPPATRKSS